MALFIIFPMMTTPVLAQTPEKPKNQIQKQQQPTKPAETAVTSDKKATTDEDQESTDDQKAILQKLQELQKQVDTLKEQGRAREKLSITAEEKAEQEKAVLSAVGREYTLMPKGKWELEYSFRYEYLSSNEITAATRVEPRANHTIRNAVAFQYGLLNNLTTNVNVPFVYVYDKTGGSQAKDCTDIGDVTLGIDYQPFKSKGEWPTATITMGAVLPTGRSPYDINRDTDLPTGSGLYSLYLGMNLSKAIDPAMAFGGISLNYRLQENGIDQYLNGLVLKEVKPGSVLSASVGMAYAISYALSMNIQFQYGYVMDTDYHFSNGTTTTTPAYSTASVYLGTGWRITPKTTLSFSVGIGLTKDDPDFTFLFRLPFDF
jgi:biopolymer transport protein ExbD